MFDCWVFSGQMTSVKTARIKRQTSTLRQFSMGHRRKENWGGKESELHLLSISVKSFTFLK